MRRAVAVAALLAAACNPDRREAEQAVRAYNEAAILAYRTREFGPLKDVAGEKEWGRVVVLVDLKSANQLVLESELQALDVTRVERPTSQTLVVGTKERWRYYDRSLKPGTAQGTTFVVEMALEYDFLGEPGHWKLDRARSLSSDYLEPKGYRYQPPPTSYHFGDGGSADAGAP